MFRRYAIYYAPAAGSQLGRSGAAWLGRDPTPGAGPVAQPVPDLPGCRPIADLTAAPRRYGLHGTLKAPMRLATGRDADALLAAIAAWAADRTPVVLGRMHVAVLGRFIAIVPLRQHDALVRFAADLVRDLDGFRAPLTDDDIARRRAAGLSARQDALLAAWGYPYVMDELRFHVTLSGPLDPHEIPPLRAAAETHFAAALAAPETLNDLAVFGEDDTGLFHLVARCPLKG
jgi:putative phosphonate metabolism protein